MKIKNKTKYVVEMTEKELVYIKGFCQNFIGFTETESKEDKKTRTKIFQKIHNAIGGKR